MICIRVVLHCFQVTYTWKWNWSGISTQHLMRWYIINSHSAPSAHKVSAEVCLFETSIQGDRTHLFSSGQLIPSFFPDPISTSYPTIHSPIVMPLLSGKCTCGTKNHARTKLLLTVWENSLAKIKGGRDRGKDHSSFSINWIPRQRNSSFFQLEECVCTGGGGL